MLGLWAVLILWVLTEIGFALHGFPGVPRYLFEAAGLMGVLAGVGVGLLLVDASRLWARLPRLAGVPVAAALVAFMIPSAISQARTEHKDIRHEQARTKEINRLSAFLTALGGPKHVEACGRPVLNVEFVSIMAWYTHRNTGTIGYRPKVEVWARRYPLVLFSTFPQRLGGADGPHGPRPEGRVREPQRLLCAHRASSRRRAGPARTAATSAPAGQTGRPGVIRPLEFPAHAPADQLRGLPRSPPCGAPAGAGRASGRARILSGLLASPRGPFLGRQPAL